MLYSWKCKLLSDKSFLFPPDLTLADVAPVKRNPNILEIIIGQ